jgi:hypothetical protein
LERVRVDERVSLRRRRDARDTADAAHAGKRRGLMNATPNAAIPPQAPIPPDDPRRDLVVARPDEDQTLPHLGVVGNTYTILLTGEDTGGRYSLIDLFVRPGGGPPPHRHDFEEMSPSLRARSS